MKDSKDELQQDFYDLINGSITYSGNAVDVYDIVPKNPSYPYIKIGEHTSNDRSNKTSFGSTDTVQFSIVDRFNSGHNGSRTRINSVANDMFGILKPSRGSSATTFTLPNFKVLRCIVENDIDLRELSDTYLYLSREIRFNLQLQEV